MTGSHTVCGFNKMETVNSDNLLNETGLKRKKGLSDQTERLFHLFVWRVLRNAVRKEGVYREREGKNTPERGNN